ncbi:aminoacyl tRNA synthase complex-interacting multifunctional protein 1-like [Neltuma alba]|uniref:aminoacyl tRNA synthase complex-interacting multifunctional protein 1-like n=1 Tax=Neltuma alba TaxID=207710 RepID=UPI0010A4F0E6|nr:aminoacyl tRNA synthase complex-interacting multifunctional protein 1-like [Prosopis alba]
MATSTIAANAIKGCSTMLSLSSLWRTRAYGSFSSLVTRSSLIAQSKFPIFSISSSPSRERRRISYPFSSFCTASTDEAVVESVATNSGDASGINEINVKDAAGLLDKRVGRILRAWKHEEADSLYVEEVDIGEPEPRIICSGLVKYIPLDHLEGKKVIVLSNLKPRNMRGVKSPGMLMAASDAKHENVELLFPPEEVAPGERIWFGSEDEKENQPAPATPNQIQKKKTWEPVQPYLKTDASCIAMLGEHVMRTSAGAVACQSLQNANIS